MVYGIYLLGADSLRLMLHGYVNASRSQADAREYFSERSVDINEKDYVESILKSSTFSCGPSKHEHTTNLTIKFQMPEEFDVDKGGKTSSSFLL